MRDPAPWQKKYERMVLLALLFGLIGQYLFVGVEAGISVPLFIISFYGLFFYSVKGRIGGFEKWQGQLRAGWLLLIPIFLLSLTYALFANSIFRVLNVLALFILIVAQTMLLTRSGSQPWHRIPFYVDMLLQWLIKPLAHIAVPFSTLGGMFKASDRTNTTRSQASKVAFGLLLAAPLLIVILMLLSSADLIFLKWLNELPQVFDFQSFGDGFVRVFVGAWLALYSFCYIWGLLFPLKESVNKMGGLQEIINANPPVPRERPGLDPVTAATFFICINLVYVLFAAIQFTYLFGAADGLLPEGTAYAEYARRGFAELVAVALLNMALLLGGLHLIRPGGRMAELVRRLSLTILISCTLVMLISAYSRLSLYEEAYGYTQIRLLVHGFMIFLAVLLAVALFRIWKESFSLSKVYICSAIIAYVVMNYANLDARIAFNNSDRFERTGVIDVHYLSDLSADAAPALLKLQAKHPDIEGLDEVIETLKRKANNYDSWQSWNLSQQRIK